MKMQKKYLVVFSVLISGFLFWYLGFKKSDYCIHFKAKTATITLFQGVEEWQKEQTKSQGAQIEILEKNNFDFIKQKYTKGTTVLEYSWEFEVINDSTTAVCVGIKEPKHSWYNRLTAPFFETKFKNEEIKKIKDFKTALEDQLSQFSYVLTGEKQTEAVFVAYISLKSVLQEKAQNMIGDDNIITGYLHQNNIQIVGKPYLEVTNWDMDHQKLAFNYCFPINKNTPYIASDAVKFKLIPAQKGLTASYFGNFRTSDRAWFAIYDYAKKHNIKLDYKPLEHFLANPFNGGDEKLWETKIIIPFAK
jgi:effector-binding domain-containing protein